MKKITLLMIFFVSLFLVGLKSVAAEAPETLVVHYYRYDDNYTNFNFWLWPHEPASLGGVQHNFDPMQKDEHGVYFEVDLNETYTQDTYQINYSGSTKLGIIIKQGAWNGYREIGGDRFIDLTVAEVVDGVAHAYFVEQDIRIGLSEQDLANNVPDYREKILRAAFDAQKRIVLSTTHIGTSYEVFEDGISKMTGSVTATSQTITVTNVDISKTYTIKVTFEGGRIDEKTVSLQNLYDTPDFENLYTYEGDLGVSFADGETIFRLWAPLSEAVSLNLYNQGHPYYDEDGEESVELTPYRTEDLTKIENGAWEVKLTGDFDFKYYTFNVTNNGITNEVTDPYAYSTGANGQRGMIVNFEETNPEGWTYGQRPNNIKNLTDYIVWELHVRDLTTHSSWNGNESYRGKFMGMTQTGTTYTAAGKTVSTGLDHIVELGVNAVQLLPIFDFGYVDEVQVATNSLYTNLFNWGYMPYHFNTLEGSYSTNPFDGAQRIREFKEVVMAFHAQDIRIIMDVVYNHTGESEGSNFHKIVPGYYHRMTNTGGFSNGSGTGNETASERSMMRKFMVDSLHFWATEYNLSGFRFDLMELHDVETMNQIKAMLEEIDPTIVVYGEPWMGGTSPLSTSVRAGKDNLDDMNNVGAFNDITRDAVKGSVFQAAEKGWVQGNTTEYTKQGIMYGVLGGIEHPSLTQINEWHKNPNQMVNYVTAHDNNTLFDKLRLSGITAQKAPQMVIQSNAIILTSQGISFLHAGVEFARSKPLPEGGYDHNSYESPDIVNQLRWDRKLQYIDVFEYYKALIQIRKTYNHFRIDSAEEILDRVTFLTTDQPLKNIAYEIAGRENEPDIIVAHVSNPTGGLSSVVLPVGKTYRLLTNTIEANPNGIEDVSGTLYIPANTTMILVEKLDQDPSVTIKENQVSINVGETFNPASNVTINNPDATIYYSSFHNTNVAGRYVVTVSVQETYGKVTHYTYTLIVGTPPFNVTLTRG